MTLAYSLGEPIKVSTLDDLGPCRDRCLEAVPVRVAAGRVLDDRHVVSRGGAVAYDRFARDTEPDDEHAAQSMTPGMRMKSA